MAKVKISKEEKAEIKLANKHWSRFIASMKAKGALIMESISADNQQSLHLNQLQVDGATQQVN